jgi:hypothetical protein
VALSRNWIDEEKCKKTGYDESVIMIEVDREPIEARLERVHGLENSPIQINRQSVNNHAYENERYKAPA